VSVYSSCPGIDTDKVLDATRSHQSRWKAYRTDWKGEVVGQGEYVPYFMLHYSDHLRYTTNARVTIAAGLWLLLTSIGHLAFSPKVITPHSRLFSVNLKTGQVIPP
jgi:hypothetical protein